MRPAPPTFFSDTSAPAIACSGKHLLPVDYRFNLYPAAPRNTLARRLHHTSEHNTSADDIPGLGIIFPPRLPQKYNTQLLFIVIRCGVSTVYCFLLYVHIQFLFWFEINVINIQNIEMKIILVALMRLI